MKKINSLDHLFEIIDSGILKLVESRQFDLSTHFKCRKLAVNFIFYLLASPVVTEFCFNNKISRKLLEDHALQYILYLYKYKY